MDLQIHAVGAELPEDFHTLADAARSEGHGLLDRLLREWSSGALRFDRPGETLLIGRLEGRIVAVGGISVDPVDASALRMRRFYVLPAARRRGVARALVNALLRRVSDAGAVGVHVGIPSAFPFWHAVGFREVAEAGITHRWESPHAGARRRKRPPSVRT